MVESISIRDSIRKRYKELFINSLDFIYVLDANGKFIDANDIALDTLGYKREEIPSIMFNDLIDETQLEKAINRFKEIIKKGRNHGYSEFKLKTKDGRFIYIETYAIPIKENGKIRAMIGIANDITDRKKAEQKLKESEERYRLISENAIDMIAIINQKFEFEYVNEEIAINLKGQSEGDLRGKNVAEVLHPEDIKKAYDALSNGFKTGEGKEEVRVRHKNGNWIWLEVKGKTYGNNKGEIYAIIIARDITERKDAAYKLSESEKILKKMVRELNCLYGISTIIDRPDISRNELIESILELVPHACQFPALTCARIIYDDIKYETDNFKETEWIFSTQVIVNEKPLKILVSSLENIPFLKSERDLIKEIGNRLKIIIEQKDSKKKLKDSEEKFRSILGNIKEGYFEIDLKGNFTFGNKYFFEIVGYTKEEAIKMNYRDICDENTVKMLFKTYNTVYMTEKNNLLFEYDLIKKNGERINIETSANLKLDSKGNKIGFYGLIRDITERKKAEQKLRESEEKYRLISENANDLILIMNQNFKPEYFNEKALSNLLGYSRNFLLENSVIDFIHPDDSISVIKEMRRGFKTGKASTEVRIKHQNGNYIWLDTKGRTFFDKDGEKKAILFSRDITERKITELKLIESEEKYRSILENIKEGYFEVDLKGNFTLVNNFLYETMGYNKEEAIKLNFQAICDKETAKMLFKIYNNVFTTEQDNLYYEYDAIKKNGERINIEASANLRRDSQGKKIGFFGLARDITERKIAEQKLRESEERYRLISENANDMIAVLNEKFQFEYINQEVTKRYMGYSNEDVIGKSSLDLIHPDDFEDSVSLLKESYAKGEGMGEVRYIKKDGEYIWLEVRGRTFIDQTGNKKALTISRDITKRKNTEHKLKQSEEKYRNILESMRDGYLEVDFKGNFTFVNTRVCEFLGYSKEELLSMNFRQVVANTEAINIFKSFNKLYNDEISDLLFDFGVFNKDGSHKFIEAYINLKSDSLSNKIGFKGLCRDITEQKEAEKLIKQEREKLKELDLLKRDLTTQLSEKLKYPLSVISDVSGVLLESYHDQLDKNAQKLIELIRDGGEKSSNMIERILDISKIESDKFELNKRVENLNKIINESIHKAYDDLEFRDVSIDLRASEDLFSEVDKVRIKQVFEYFLISSLKAVPKKGSISIFLKEKKNYAIIEIKSSGIELRQDEFPFEIQYSDEIIKLHQGDIIREFNREEKSRVIKIRLPVIKWVNQLIHIFIIYKSGVLLYDHPFVKERDSSESLIISGGLIGTMSILKEIIKSGEHIDHIDHGDRKIMFELNNTEEIVFALLVKELNPVIRRKLNSLIRDFEIYFKEKIKEIKYTSMRSDQWREAKSLIKTHFRYQD